MSGLTELGELRMNSLISEDYNLLTKIEDQYTGITVESFFNLDTQTIILKIQDSRGVTEIGPMALTSMKTLRIAVDDILFAKGIRP